MNLKLQLKIIIISILINLDVILNDGLHFTDTETVVNVREATSSTTSTETSSEEKVLDCEVEHLLNKDSYEDADDVINDALRLGGAKMREKEKAREERKTKQRKIIDDMHKKRSEESNMKRLIEIKKFMINNIKATHYLYEEVKRIKRDREVLDDIRKVVIEAESVGGRMRAALTNCTVEISKKFKIDIWSKKPNRITWFMMNDPFSNY